LFTTTMLSERVSFWFLKAWRSLVLGLLGAQDGESCVKKILTIYEEFILGESYEAL